MLALVLVPATLSGCRNPNLYDFDGDGSPDIEDCAPEDPEIYPGAPDAYGDDIDQSCDQCGGGAGDGIDRDCDGYPANADLSAEDRDLYDCNDEDDSIHPDAFDVPNDGIDQDCDYEDCVDLDSDTFCAGFDCDDDRADVYVGAPEVADCADHDCDGVASDGTVGADDDGDGACEGVDLGAGMQCCEIDDVPGDCDDTSAAANLQDLDVDGVTTCGPDGLASSGDEDCDDADDDRLPDNEEVCDRKDNDCDGVVPGDEVDGDTDGETPCEGDCDDADPALHDLDLDFDGVSACAGDCDDNDPTLRPFDNDLDGVSTCDGDCADLDPNVYPGANEGCDGVDTNCDGVLPPTEVDADADGFPLCNDCDDNDPTLNGDDVDGDTYTPCDGDCDDTLATTNPSATDIVGDAIDQNCDGVDGTDTDGDGYASLASGGDDCDDTDATLHPGDFDGDGVTSCDGDCDDTDPTVESADVDGDGYSTCLDDCDDNAPAIYPHATEIPGDGVDDNCDGLDICEDLNCDGWTDVLFTNNFDGATFVQDSWIYWGGAAGYSAADRFDIPTNGGGDVRVADLDGDGYLDIAIANQGSQTVFNVDSWIYWGGPAGFSTGNRTSLPTTAAAGIEVADLDADGYLDIVFSSYWDGVNPLVDSWIYWGSPTGYSTGARTAVPTSGAWGNTVADVDKDGFLDIVFANARDVTQTAVDSWIYWGSSGPYSTSNRAGLATDGAYGALVVDLDDDGWNEVVFSGFWNWSSYSMNAMIHWGSSTGFSGVTLLPTKGGTGLTAGDMDGDGDLDLVLSCERDGPVFNTNSWIYWNAGGTFSATDRQALETYGAVVNFQADLDGDGTLDILFANWRDDTTYTRTSYIYWGTTGTYSAADRTELPTIGAAGVVAAGPGIPVLRTIP